MIMMLKYICAKNMYVIIYLKMKNLIEFMFNQSIVVQRKFHISK
jgi:hypothetical protein